MHRIVSEIGGDMIAIAAIVMGIGCAMFSLYLHSRRKREFLQMHHAERMAAIEKGIELPPVPPQFFHDTPTGLGTCCYRRRSGVVTLLVGVAIMVEQPWAGRAIGRFRAAASARTISKR